MKQKLRLSIQGWSFLLEYDDNLALTIADSFTKVELDWNALTAYHTDC
jgi:hypothetical protein